LLIWISKGQVRWKPVTDLGLTVLSIVIGGVLAAIRARTIRSWSEGYGVRRIVWQQGNWLTALLWIAGIGRHLLARRLRRTGPRLDQSALRGDHLRATPDRPHAPATSSPERQTLRCPATHLQQ
jgi:hypothetical protein